MAFRIPRHASLPYFLALPAAGLLLAYLYALAHRPKYPDQYAIDDPTTYEYPAWYNSTPSPYDAQPIALAYAEDIDVVLWIDLPYDSPNVAHALSTIRALEWAPSITVRPIMTHGSSWDDNLDASQNIEAFGCGKWIWRIAEGATKSKACKGAVWISEILPEGSEESSLDNRHDARADIELLSRPQELFEPESSYTTLKKHFGEGWQLGFLSHIVPFADPAEFYPSSRAARKSVTFFPSSFSAENRYPSIPWGPGWRLYKPATIKPPFLAGENSLADGSKYRAFWEREEARKAQAMRTSGICIFEGWETGILSADMAKAMLSGCVVAMASPQVHKDILEPLIITLPKFAFEAGKIPSQAITSAQVKISDSEFKLRSLRSFIVGRQIMTPTSRVNSVKELVQTWQDGARGYNLPHAFQWDCDSKPRPPWC